MASGCGRKAVSAHDVAHMTAEEIFSFRQQYGNRLRMLLREGADSDASPLHAELLRLVALWVSSSLGPSYERCAALEASQTRCAPLSRRTSTLQRIVSCYEPESNSWQCQPSQWQPCVGVWAKSLLLLCRLIAMRTCGSTAPRQCTGSTPLHSGWMARRAPIQPSSGRASL